MEWQNYNHLFYFWMIVKEGGVTKAAEKLRLAQSTISAQMRLLEDSLGEKLFEKDGRKLKLTEAGQIVHRYTEEIFSLGQEMKETLRGKPSGKSLQMVVGVTDAMPKLITYQLLEPAFHMPENVYLTCKEDHLQNLLTELALHQLDIVLSDTPLDSVSNVKAYNHLLGECGVSFFGTKSLKQSTSKKFPDLLEGAPFLLPGKGSLLRKNLEHWFEAKKVSPYYIAEFADSALIKVFAQTGMGFFVAPTCIEKEIQRQYEVVVVGRTKEITEKFYAISVERKLKHPAVLAICDSARKKLF
ncbi:MAG: transcriptional activator NhaR [Deltaproteobacteria bacterium]|nr:transcriptional activator NhaR [Deltaproteobacteria bacterium]